MTKKEISAMILNELANCFSMLDENAVQELENRIKKAGKIYVAGAGRSLMMIRGFAMRLMHIGYTSYVVGETITPAIEPGDLLIIASGSGATGSLVVIAQKCKKIGADLALITATPDSEIGRLSDLQILIHTVSCKTENHSEIKTCQPGSSTFEQSVLLLGDTVIVDLTSENTLERNNELLMKKHANLE